ncbi:MAG: hypothetical protein IKY52_08575 [Clostridia bacterium]|nr:hypothetical protein [Clostridia bacterium]
MDADSQHLQMGEQTKNVFDHRKQRPDSLFWGQPGHVFWGGFVRHSLFVLDGSLSRIAGANMYLEIYIFADLYDMNVFAIFGNI